MQKISEESKSFPKSLYMKNIIMVLILVIVNHPPLKKWGLPVQ